MVTMIVAGRGPLSRVQIDLLPAVEMPTVSVRTSYAGQARKSWSSGSQNPRRNHRHHARCQEISSSSSEGSSSIDVTFAGARISTPPARYAAASKTRSTSSPTILPAPASANSISQIFRSLSRRPGDLDPVELTTLIEDQLRYRFGRIPGVAQVDLWGGWARDPDRAGPRED